VEDRDLNLTRLFKLCPSATWLSLLAMSCKGKLLYYAWPNFDPKGWYFVVELQESTKAKAEIPAELTSLFGEKWKESVRLAADSYPINCTIPELLRDLYRFPVNGHVDAIAFDPDLIGRHRYNVAQAALRRACSRLWDRRLIVMRSGRWDRLGWSHVYVRSGIGLTDAGVAIADRLLTSVPDHPCKQT
jgi:hypothetical protein